MPPVEPSTRCSDSRVSASARRSPLAAIRRRGARAACLLVWLMGVAAGLAVLGGDVSPALSQQRLPQQIHWFSELLTAEPVALPAPITIAVEPSLGWDGGTTLVIANPGATPLYLLKPRLAPPRHAPPFDVAALSLPESMWPASRVVRNQVFYLAEAVQTPHFPVGGWVRINQALAVYGRSPVLVAPVERRNVEEAVGPGMSRPADVQVPEPQHSALWLLYEDALLQVPVTITYALNPNYERVREAAR
jgi:hypothetical protein